ncbi:flagellar motor switch protein FliN [Kineococcus gynurae]|uniref:Flagellar motor switch protein FliN n=1 Tax=Kineococcus gynurae TaxID=452979 RepID=A0ABV5LR44_9ACTN
MSTATTTDAQAFVRQAAEAALGALPLPTPGQILEIVPAAAAPDLGSEGSAVVARFAGAQAGTLVIVLGEAALEALSSSPGGALDPVDALRPAMETAVATLGPCTLEHGAEAEPAEALAALGGVPAAGVAVIGTEDGPLALIGLVAGDAPVTAASTSASPGAPRRTMDLLRDVQMDVTVELGRTTLTVQELLSLTPGSIVELDRAAGSPADILVNGQLIARGEVVVVDEDYAIRVTEIVTPGTEVGA